MTTTITETPQVWVGCLACYNSGALVGKWIDADVAGECTSAEIHESVWPPTAGHDGRLIVNDDEELWCMDFQGFPEGAMGGECSPMEAQRIAEKLEELEKETGMPLGAIAAYASSSSIDIVDLDADELQDHWYGEFESEKDFAYDFAHDTSSREHADWLDESYGSYIDWDRVWEGEFHCNGWEAIDTPDYKVWVFSP